MNTFAIVTLFADSPNSIDDASAIYIIHGHTNEEINEVLKEWDTLDNYEGDKVDFLIEKGYHLEPHQAVVIDEQNDSYITEIPYKEVDDIMNKTLALAPRMIGDQLESVSLVSVDVSENEKHKTIMQAFEDVGVYKEAAKQIKNPLYNPNIIYGRDKTNNGKAYEPQEVSDVMYLAIPKEVIDIEE